MENPLKKKRTVITTETHEIWVVRSPNGEVIEFSTNAGHTGPPTEILRLLQCEEDDSDVAGEDS